MTVGIYPSTGSRPVAGTSPPILPSAMETKLDRARRHVDEARQIVVDQQARIARLERAGRSTVTARILLASLMCCLALEEQAARQAARLAKAAHG